MFYKADNPQGAPLPFRRLRTTIGVALAVVAGALGLLYGLALINPWRLVALDKYFGNPLWGLFIVGAATYIVLRLLLPVRNEAVQRIRLRIRAVPLAFAALGLLLWGLIGSTLHNDYDELTRSDSGDRAVGLVTDNGDRQHARAWVGAGLLTRDVGDLGRVCGVVTARFLSNELIEINTSRASETWEIGLDPVTGAPLQRLGPHCADGPEPVE